MPVIGDLSKARLGVDDEEIERLAGQIEHFFHLAAIYDLTADADSQRAANVEGTRHALQLAEAVHAEHFHQVSSIAAAGLYRGRVHRGHVRRGAGRRAQPVLPDQARVRGASCATSRRCRGASTGPAWSSAIRETGEIDKIDGPYYFFKTLQRLRGVSAVVAARHRRRGRRDQHRPGRLRGARRWTTSPTSPASTARRSTSPTPSRSPSAGCSRRSPRRRRRRSRRVNVDARALDALPLRLDHDDVAAARRAQLTDLALAELGIPRESFAYLTYPTHFDSTKTQRGAGRLGHRGAAVRHATPRHLWEYWERTYSPDRRKDKQLARAIKGKTVMITGASSGIGRATALRVGAAGGRVMLVARGVEKLEQTKHEIEDLGGVAFVHRCDLADMSDIERMAKEVLQEHGRVDVLVNNAGRSIRRSIALSYDRFHDFERTMQLNYFGPVRLILSLLPIMRQASPDGRKGGHIINVSSIGVQTNIPRFSAYVASKAALDAFSRCIASEVIDDGVHLTTIHMPLVRTPMIAPTKMYDRFPTMSPAEAADMICKAMIRKPKKVGTAMGNAGALAYQVAPRGVDVVLNAGYKMFPDSHAARGGKDAKKDEPSTESVAFAHILRGVHW